MNLGPLIGIGIVVIGFALRANTLAVVTLAGVAIGLAGRLGVVDTISALGNAYIDNRYLAACGESCRRSDCWSARACASRRNG